MASYIEQALIEIERFERTIPWMYLDSTGKVRVGVGLLLPAVADATRLPFQVGARAATEQEIAADFARVDALPMGRPTLFYRKHGGPELELTVIDALLRTGLVGLEQNLREGIAGYDTFPSGVKIALLDMAHHLNPGRLLSEYPRLIHAVETGLWSQAAAASFRHGPGAARNQWTAAMFRAGLEPGATPLPRSGLERETSIQRLAYGLIGISAAVLSRIRKPR